MTIQGLESLVAAHPFFAGLAPEDAKFIAGCAKNVAYREGEMLFRAGDPAMRFFVVRHGLVALELHPPGRDLFRFSTVGEGEIFGWSWLIPPYRHRLDARALELTRVLEFDGACLRNKCDGDPRLGYELMKRVSSTLADRLQNTQLQLLDVYGTRR